MIYLLSLLALTLNPIVWKAYYRSKVFLYTQLLRVILGAIIIFILTYFQLIDYSVQAAIKFSLFYLALFFLADIIYRKAKGFYYTSFLGIAMLVASAYFQFVYPLTIANDKYDFVAAKATVAKEQEESTDEQHIAVVPEKYARYRSEKKLGELSHASYYDLGESTLQKIDDHLYWVTPIEYTGFFKWMKDVPVPGFVKMSAEDENKDAVLVKSEMTYVPSAYFNEDLKRLVRKKHKDSVLLEASFEPDDNDKPYYVVPYGDYNKFREIVDVKGIYIIDPESGEIKDYKMNEIPAFIDHVIPTSVAEDWNEWYGKYVHGFWNTIFSKEDIKVPTEWEDIDEVNGVFNKDLALNWFTDFTRPKSDSGSMVGYSLINARDGKLTFYENANGSLNGKSAINVAEKTFRAEKYEAGTPILYTIYGQFTWVVPLMDSNNVLRQIVLVNAKDEKVYSYSNEKSKLFNDYKYAIATLLKDDNTVPTDLADMKELQGTISNVYKSEMEGSTVVRFMVDKDKRIFQVSSNDFPYSIFLEKGMNVSVKYMDTEEVVVSVQELVMAGFE
ncbi:MULTISPECIES: hypothetical protein [Bacillaceae]|uniref:hypothetical protein n=1 Tax=Bacillaceae TaxID=186817 RepID=UPI001E418C19|nr:MULTISPECIES: hypothetical protein [Bacillaceae]MCE4049955.1 hypothetical protein [Bacillus sp. Au-Bac7]MDL0436907.1 hypothetical protein [Niallia sp. SS-2023]UPO88021.1 hypothetical protein L8T27_002135 [Niallia sp. Man26]